MRNDWRTNRIWAAGLALALFLAGMASGFAASRLFGQREHRPHDPGALLERYRDVLGLTDEQTRKIAPVLERHERAMGELFERVDPEAEAIHRQANGEVRAQLDPAQTERFEAMLAEFQQRRAAMRQRVEAARRGETKR